MDLVARDRPGARALDGRRPTRGIFATRPALVLGDRVMDRAFTAVARSPLEPLAYGATGRARPVHRDVPARRSRAIDRSGQLRRDDARRLARRRRARTR